MAVSSRRSPLFALLAAAFCGGSLVGAFSHGLSAHQSWRVGAAPAFRQRQQQQQQQQQHQFRRSAASTVARRASDDDRVPESEKIAGSSTGGSDIDAEWKKLMAGEGQPSVRPKDIEVSDIEFATKKLKSKAVTLQKQIVPDATIEIKTPSWKRLSSDWKFWLALIVAVSVLPAFFGSMAQPPPYGAGSGGGGGFTAEPVDYVVFNHATQDLFNSLLS